MTDILTRDDCLTIIEKRRQGVTLVELQKQYFTNHKTIHVAMKQYDLWEMFTESKHFRIISRLKQAIELRLDCYSTKQICTILGFNESSLRRSLKRHNLFDDFVNARIKNPLYDVKVGKDTYDISITFLKNRREIYGASSREIAKELGCNKDVILRRSKRYNIGKADRKTAAKNRERGPDALLQKRGRS